VFIKYPAEPPVTQISVCINCDCPDLLHFLWTFVVLFRHFLRDDWWFIGELRHVRCFWTENCLVLRPVSVDGSGTMSPQEASHCFLETWICLLTCHNLFSEGYKITASMCEVRDLSLGTAFFSRVVAWLAYADYVMALVNQNQPIGDEFLSGMGISLVRDKATFP
jgi:hypothetical protein